jgi:hypothetical protein
VIHLTISGELPCANMHLSSLQWQRPSLFSPHHPMHKVVGARNCGLPASTRVRWARRAKEIARNTAQHAKEGCPGCRPVSSCAMLVSTRTRSASKARELAKDTARRAAGNGDFASCRKARRGNLRACRSRQGRPSWSAPRTDYDIATHSGDAEYATATRAT